MALVACAAFCFTASCSVKVINHNQSSASKAAEKFANLAFIQSDYANAYQLLDAELQKMVTQEKLTETVSKMHTNGRPATIQAIEYEPMPGQRAMQIYLKGTQGKEEFYYRFVMTGDLEAGYKIGGLFRGTGPYPPSNRKPL